MEEKARGLEHGFDDEGGVEVGAEETHKRGGFGDGEGAAEGEFAEGADELFGAGGGGLIAGDEL